MDETGQAGGPDPAGGQDGTNGHGANGHRAPEGVWPGPAATSDASLAALVSSWREPVSGAIGGRASAGGRDGGRDGAPVRGRAEVRPPFDDLLAPVSPPVAIPPPPTHHSAISGSAISGSAMSESAMPGSAMPEHAEPRSPAAPLPFVPEPALRELPVEPHQPVHNQPVHNQPVHNQPVHHRPVDPQQAHPQPMHPQHAVQPRPAPPQRLVPTQFAAHQAADAYRPPQSQPQPAGYPPPNHVQPVNHPQPPTYAPPPTHAPAPNHGQRSGPPQAEAPAAQQGVYGTTYGAPYGQDRYGQDPYAPDPYGPDQYGHIPYDDEPFDEDTQGWPPDLPPGYEPMPMPAQGYAPEAYQEPTPLFDEQRHRSEPAPPQYDWSGDALSAQTPVHGAPALGAAPLNPPEASAAGLVAPGHAASGHASSGYVASGHVALGHGADDGAAPGYPVADAATYGPAGPDETPERAMAGPSVAGYAAPGPVAPAVAAPGGGTEAGTSAHGALPQRVPSEPDVPPVPVEAASRTVTAPPADGPDLARIAAHLRHDEDDEPLADGRPDGFDIPAVIQAVRGVAGVREAHLRTNPDGVHTLRLELFDDADAGWVSRAVARLLNERMGLAAEPSPATPLLPGAPGRQIPAPRGPLPPIPHNTSPSYGREARRRRPVSGLRRAPEPPPASEAAHASQVVPVDESQYLAGLPGYQTERGESTATAAPRPATLPSARIVIDHVEVGTTGVDAVVEVRLLAEGRPAVGVARGPAVDGYVMRLSAVAAASAIDELLDDVDADTRPRCFIEHAAAVPFGSCEVAVVVLLLVCDGWVEQLTGSAVVAGDARQAVVRATLAAVNRRLEGLLP